MSASEIVNDEIVATERFNDAPSEIYNDQFDDSERVANMNTLLAGKEPL